MPDWLSGLGSSSRGGSNHPIAASRIARKVSVLANGTPAYAGAI